MKKLLRKKGVTMKKAGIASNEDGSTADREETAEEKRVRIAKEYLRTCRN